MSLGLLWEKGVAGRAPDPRGWGTQAPPVMTEGLPMPSCSPEVATRTARGSPGLWVSEAIRDAEFLLLLGLASRRAGQATCPSLVTQ